MRHPATAPGRRALALAAALSAPAAALAQPAAELPALEVTGRRPEALTAPSAEAQRRALEQTPAAVRFVDGRDLANRYAFNLRDVLADTPGVFVQNRYGQELRLSVRGSGIARGFHLRGVEVLQDGIPVNLADGSGDFYQIDPLAVRSAAVYPGGNALAFGTSTLGGAIDFVTPTAYTAEAPNILRAEGGSFGTWRLSGQVSRIFGDGDALANATVLHSDGYRRHSRSQYEQFNANVGYRVAPDVETRFYAGAYIVRQLLPGSLSLSDALERPRAAAPAAVLGNQARNVWAERFANRTSAETGAAAAALAGATASVWLRRDAPPAVRSAALIAAAYLATPYAYLYDAPVLTAAAAFLVKDGVERGFRACDKALLCLAHLLPGLVLAGAANSAVGPAAALLLFLLALRRAAPWPAADGRARLGSLPAARA